MIFSSVIFIFLFLPIVLAGYFLIRVELRNLFLLIVSLIFYATGEPKFVLVMIASIILNYIFGLLIDYTKKHSSLLSQRIILTLGVLANLSILFYFKYLDFFLSTINYIATVNIPLQNIVLPIGISFFTFQGMSYILDVYMEKVEVQKKFINVALYVALFPQLIAGPIVRYRDVNEQIDYRVCTEDQFAQGIRRFIMGQAKKVIIANNMGLIADQIFDKNPLENTFSIAWLGIVCYTLQIYFDFSGYSDMAIGLGKMFGFEFLENFNYPYISKSITEFWRRWHISLSSWFRDYIYIPLGGNRTGNVYFNLLVVFLVTGIWHGAAWNFIVWGLWHGMFIIIEKILKQKHIEIKLPKIVKWAWTMILVMIGWVLFRAPTFTFALEYLSILFGIAKGTNTLINIYWYLSPKSIIILILGLIISVPLKEVFSKPLQVFERTYLKEVVINTWLVGLFFIVIVLVMTSTYNPFIYFRF